MTTAATKLLFERMAVLWLIVWRLTAKNLAKEEFSIIIQKSVIMVRQEGPAIRLTSLKGFTQLLQNQFPTASAGTKVSVLLPIEEVCESSDFSGMIQKKQAQKAG